MKTIRPVSELRNNFAEISKIVHETAQPVFLQFESEVFLKLQVAESEASLTNQRYSSKDVLKAMKEVIDG